MENRSYFTKFVGWNINPISDYFLFFKNKYQIKSRVNNYLYESNYRLTLDFINASHFIMEMIGNFLFYDLIIISESALSAAQHFQNFLSQPSWRENDSLKNRCFKMDYHSRRSPINIFIKSMCRKLTKWGETRKKYYFLK